MNSPNRADSDLRIIISSCDKYSDTWAPHIAAWELFWPDCPWKVSIISEGLDIPSQNSISNIKAGSDKTWSMILSDALKSIDEDHILLLLDDFILKRSVDTAKIRSLYDLFLTDNLNMLRLIPRPGPNKIVHNKQYGFIDVSEPYRVSTQAAYWKKSVLLDLLCSDETPWEFELNGSKRSLKYARFASSTIHALPYFHHDIQNGRWFPWSVLYLKYLEIDVDTKSRPIMSLGDTIRFLIFKALRKLYNAFQF